MRFPLILLAAVATAQGSSAFSCSLPIREHPILASHPPIATESGFTTVRIAVSDVLLPARFGKTQYPFQHIWLGLRGTKLGDSNEAVSPDHVEVAGNIDVICFYPSDAYKLLPDGRLVVWISGKFPPDNAIKLVLPTDGLHAESANGVWRPVRWSINESEDAAALPSTPQQVMIQP